MKNQIKLYIFSLVLIITVCSFANSVLAAEMSISTTVPTHVPVELIIIGEGRVEVDGKIYSESGVVDIPRHKEILYTIAPADGYRVENIQYCGVNITDSLVNNSYTVSQVGIGDVLTVAFAPIADTPITGDDSKADVWMSLMLISAAMFAVIFKNRKFVK